MTLRLKEGLPFQTGNPRFLQHQSRPSAQGGVIPHLIADARGFTPVPVILIPILQRPMEIRRQTVVVGRGQHRLPAVAAYPFNAFRQAEAAVLGIGIVDIHILGPRFRERTQIHPHTQLFYGKLLQKLHRDRLGDIPPAVITGVIIAACERPALSRKRNLQACLRMGGCFFAHRVFPSCILRRAIHDADGRRRFHPSRRAHRLPFSLPAAGYPRQKQNDRGHHMPTFVFQKHHLHITIEIYIDKLIIP